MMKSPCLPLGPQAPSLCSPALGSVSELQKRSQPSGCQRKIDVTYFGCTVHARYDESGGGKSYLQMWKRAKERQEEEQLQKWAEGERASIDKHSLKKKEEDFSRILQVPNRERDHAQQMQVIERAAAALAAAEALLASRPPVSVTATDIKWKEAVSRGWGSSKENNILVPEDASIKGGEILATVVAQTPGPSFWSWSPPAAAPLDVDNKSNLKLKAKEATLPKPRVTTELLELDRPSEDLNIAFESIMTDKKQDTVSLPYIFESSIMPSLPPLQSLMEVKQNDSTTSVSTDIAIPSPKFSELKTASLKSQFDVSSKAASGTNPDGSRWWKESGVENRGNGITCNWTVTRGVSADGTVEWENKFWEASDRFDYKELGAEKSGRDADGNVWREFWKEATWQDANTGLMHIEKSAEKWGRNDVGGEWLEKWLEHYDASGWAEKWADKWSRIDPATPLNAGHAHVWHERWGEEFDGKGGSMKYSDKWADRAEGDGRWTKWGDKWDQRFDKNGHGTKQGETWWAGENCERWNRTWGEGHNGTGWVHKYGQSSSGEHWDTYEQEETWYETKPHFGFYDCLNNSQELLRVGKKRDQSL